MNKILFKLLVFCTSISFMFLIGLTIYFFNILRLV